MTQRRMVLALAALLVAAAVAASPAAGQESYTRISGEGSTWAKNAIDDMKSDVAQFGMVVDYGGTGSTAGRQAFIRGVVDFAASDIPFVFEPEDGSPPERPPVGGYAYIPITAGGTSFIYNLKINGQRVTNLRLSGENVAKIFTGVITRWDDPALKADNPGLALPGRPIQVVVRSEGSGSTAQFTQWMIHQHKGLWDDFCRRSGRAPACGSTSFYPTTQGMLGKAGDDGVTAAVVQGSGEGAIGYVNYSYAVGQQFPVAKVLNAAGYYTEPTPENVAVSLLKAKINRDESSPDYLTQELDGVYTDSDPRNYQLSSYSYFILRTKVTPDARFDEDKGRTLGAFAYYAMCQAQQRSASLGYSPMPINLVEASFEQIRKIPGVEVQNVNVAQCGNPTFSPDGRNLLVERAPMPDDCDKPGPTQCATGTGGARRTPTAVTGGGGSGGGGGGTAGGAGSGGGPGGAGGPGGTGGGTGDAATGGAAEEVCDPDTGVCSSGGPAGDLGGSGGETASATPSVLAASRGWSATQTLAVVVTLLLLALVLGPALLWRRLSPGDGP